MVKEKMTVHQALCELKTLRKRISKAIEATNPVAVKYHGAGKVNGMTTEEFKTLAKSAHDTAVDLIRRQNAIKAAVNEYNSWTKVKVCGQEYTVAQAIWLMQYGMNDKKALLNRYVQMLDSVNAQIVRSNGDELRRRAETFAVNMYGVKDKADPKDFNTAMDDYIDKHTVDMVDPLGIRKIISELEKEISDFESNVDAAIQVANATSTIEIEY